jgi:molybdenum cofactor cytidylyltransferase
MAEPVVPGVLLAGGSGSRFDGPTHKLLSQFRGRRIVEWGVDAIRSSGLQPWIVWGALADDPPALGDDVVVLTNPAWRDGMSTTLGVAVAEARRRRLATIVVGPADQPLIPGEAWRLVAEADSPIAVATYLGKRANPVKLDAVVWGDLPSSGDFGARHLIKMRPDLVLEVACPGNPADIDTREDLERWNSSTNSL